MKLRVYKSNICKTLRIDIEISRGLSEDISKQIDVLGESRDLHLIVAARDEFSRRFKILKDKFAHVKDTIGDGSRISFREDNIK